MIEQAWCPDCKTTIDQLRQGRIRLRGKTADAYLCARCGLKYPFFPTPSTKTRESEGWTSTLAKLIGPEPEESDAVKYWWCGCRCHKPGGIAGPRPEDSCLGCAYMHNPETLSEDLKRGARCKYEQHHGPGAVCNYCGYIGQIVL